METKEKNFSEITSTTRTLFFNNCSVVVSKDGIEIVERYNADKVIPHKFRELAPAFHMQGNRLVIDSLDSKVFRYLINGSRMNWRAELETGDDAADAEYFAQNRFTPYGSRLNMGQQYEQMVSLVNKIYAYGYLLHHFKKDDMAKCVWIAGKDESLYCLGKSLFMNILRSLQLANIVTLDGRDSDIIKNNYLLNRISSDTDILFIDDASNNFRFADFYHKVTGQIIVNPKGSEPFEISNLFGVISSDYLPHDMDRATLRRIIPIVFSDYYHVNGFHDKRYVSSELGILFGQNYTEDEYNADYNFMINCLQFYLAHQDNAKYPIIDEFIKK